MLALGNAEGEYNLKTSIVMELCDRGSLLQLCDRIWGLLAQDQSKGFCLDLQMSCLT